MTPDLKKDLESFRRDLGAIVSELQLRGAELRGIKDKIKEAREGLSLVQSLKLRFLKDVEDKIVMKTLELHNVKVEYDEKKGIIERELDGIKLEIMELRSKKSSILKEKSLVESELNGLVSEKETLNKYILRTRDESYDLRSWYNNSKTELEGEIEQLLTRKSILGKEILELESKIPFFIDREKVLADKEEEFRIKESVTNDLYQVLKEKYKSNAER